ncbi:MAG: beta-Ala-His dipeptidase [Candidatus Niyogibacteria bacterium]|nr:beta-Ala-His dipeptidase [Candidatus Niyogibacteria bacterium]
MAPQIDGGCGYHIFPTFVSELEPKEIWKHFDSILNIPRGSGEEDAIREYVLWVAKNTATRMRDLTIDDVGNVIIRKSATLGYEDRTMVTLQSHKDMVNTIADEESLPKGFEPFPIRPIMEDGWLVSKYRTLGADNGVGVCIMLAIMESESVVHGPLEFLFTVDEETGLTGARKLQSGFLKGKYLLNLDSEEEGVITIGCAGGARAELRLPIERAVLPSSPYYKIFTLKISDCKGGHSGLDIHLGRANAIKVLAQILREFHYDQLRLIHFEGGSRLNVIPQSASATIAVPRMELQEFIDVFMIVKGQYKKVDPDMKLTIQETHDMDVLDVLTESSYTKTLSLLGVIPHGVLAMSKDVKDLVETSNNLATVRMNEGEMKIEVMYRSLKESALVATQDKINSLASIWKADVTTEKGYGCWQPDPNSYLLSVAKETYKNMFAKDPEIMAIHAGFESGVIKATYPSMETISIGPSMQNVHIPGERVHIASVAKFYSYLCELLKNIQ